MQSQPLGTWKLGLTTSHGVPTPNSQVWHECLHSITFWRWGSGLVLRATSNNFRFTLSIGVITHAIYNLVSSKPIELVILNTIFRATSHMSQEPQPWNCESHQKSVQRPSQYTSKIMQRGHGPSSVVWSHMWMGPQPNSISMNFYSYMSSHIIE